MSWSQAAEQFLATSQTESEELDEAEALRRSFSGDEAEFHRTGVPVSTPVLPELFWVKPLLNVLLKHVGLEQRSRSPLMIASCCSGTLAEASVLEALKGIGPACCRC